ncbi:MAG: AAA family ATPase [Proteobacteria bacterium]|nr:AAA family ATPase [Pseudomonadota bacterium]
MGRFLNPGNGGFQRIIDAEVYVDKTGILGVLNKWINKDTRYVCVSRARRFGKTVAARTIRAYYDNSCDSHDLFAPYAIAQDPSYEIYINKYDVIGLDVQSFFQVGQDPKTFIARLSAEVLAEVCSKWSDIEGLKEKTLADALIKVHEKTGARFVFVIDEWDAVFRFCPNDEALQKDWIHFLRDLFKQEDMDAVIALAYMTGILPVKKYKTQSSLNQFEEYTMLRPLMLEPFVGFLPTEVDALCEMFGMNRAEAAEWYDGYMFAHEHHVYNPCSLARAMKNREYGSYWTQTDSFESLLDYINADLDGIYDDVMCLIGGGRVNIDTVSYDNSFTVPKCKDDCFTLLTHIGYLAYDAEASQVFIPNEEVRMAFRAALKQCAWPDAIKPYQRSRKFIQSILSEDNTTVARMVEETHQNMTSVLMYNNENALSCVISVLCFFAENQYKVIREFPTGKGFADIVLLPKKRIPGPAMVIELKFKQEVKAAIDQIHEKHYPDSLKNFYGELILVGISYNKKKAHECVIERFEREEDM